MEAVKEAGLLKFVQSLEKGLNSDVGNAGASLSGGQRQKIGIARALLSKSEYMIFDEATSSVDPESEKEIWETIGHLENGHYKPSLKLAMDIAHVFGCTVEDIFSFED